MCPLYVAGLIGPGDRRVFSPWQNGLHRVDYDQLHHFVSAGVWDAVPLETELLIQADQLVGGSDAVLVIDDTAVPKKGTHSVGVAAEICLSAGQDGQLPDTGFPDTRTRRSTGDGGVAPFSSRRLDERSGAIKASWCPGRISNCADKTGDRPDGDRSHDVGRCALRLCGGGCRLRTQCAVPSGPYGSQACSAVGIPRHLKVYPVGVQLIWPITKVRGRPRKRHVPDILSIVAEDMLANAQWKNVSWRSGTKGRLKARFAAVRVRTADGPPQRIWDKGQQHLPGDEAWLIGEQRLSGEKKYYLADLPAEMDLRNLAATIKARWICEQAHQQLKEELGLDHFEGRSWQGLHRHALMTMIAYAFLQHRRLTKVRRKESTGHRLNQLCQPCATLSSASSFNQILGDVRTVERGSAPNSSVSNLPK